MKHLSSICVIILNVMKGFNLSDRIAIFLVGHSNLGSPFLAKND